MLTPQKKETDYQALQAPFMRIPHFPVGASRDLLDLGIREIHQLRGRCPDALYEQLKCLKPATFPERLAHLRMAVYYAESDDPDHSLLHPDCWKS